MIKKIKEFLETVSMPRFLIQAAIGAVFVSVVGMIYIFTGTKSPVIWICGAALYFFGLLLYGRFVGNILHGGNEAESTSSVDSMTFGILTRLQIPALICNSNENIIWLNSALKERIGKKSPEGQSLKEFSGHDLQDFKSADDLDGLIIHQKGDEYTYKVNYQTFMLKSKRYHFLLWNDISDIVKAEKTIADEETQVALILADNIDELAQYAKESTRAAANEIEDILKAWAAENGGILKEYQENKYIFLFRAATLRSFESNKFDILNRVRDVRVGQSSLSVTISIGVSKVNGTLAEKERIASEALDLALQGGGDQVIVKNPSGVKQYGGMTQSVQKRTKVSSRVVANQLSSLISQSSRVLIMGHKTPDFDCIGACIGIARLCVFCGVPFNIISDKSHPNFIRCYERISGLPEYSSDVFVNASEAQELVGSDVLTVVVDVSEPRIFEAPEVVSISSRTVYIDHHRKSSEFTDAPVMPPYIEPSASSTCELISEILEQALPSGMLSVEEANVMYAGMLLDTNQFTRNTGVRTFGAALYLRGEGASPAEVQTMFKSSIDELVLEAKFESNVVIYRKCIAIACNNSPDNTLAEKIPASKAADKLMTVEGVIASFVLCRIGDEVHISARSGGKFNVEDIMKSLGGGGHFGSAAAKPIGTMKEVFEKLKELIDSCIDGKLTKSED